MKLNLIAMAARRLVRADKILWLPWGPEEVIFNVWCVLYWLIRFSHSAPPMAKSLSWGARGGA